MIDPATLAQWSVVRPVEQAARECLKQMFPHGAFRTDARSDHRRRAWGSRFLQCRKRRSIPLK